MSEQLDLDAIEARAEKATPGPWETRFMYRLFRSTRNDPKAFMGTDQKQDWSDAEFIAHAREDIPTMAREVRRLRDELFCPCTPCARGNHEECEAPKEPTSLTREEVAKLKSDRDLALARATAAEARVAEMTEILHHAHAWMRPDGCDCGTDEPGSCALCETERVLEIWPVRIAR